jgi:hypothetical protein
MLRPKPRILAITLELHSASLRDEQPKSSLLFSEMPVMVSSKALVSNEMLLLAYLLIGNIDVVPVTQSMDWRIVELCI